MNEKGIIWGFGTTLTRIFVWEMNDLEIKKMVIIMNNINEDEDYGDDALPCWNRLPVW